MQKMMNCLINHIIYCQPRPEIVFIYQVSRIDHYIAQYAGWFNFRVHKNIFSKTAIISKNQLAHFGN